MSRIRIVGGSITKTTEGAHHMYSEENIVFNSNKTITEVGEKNGIVYGEPKEAPEIKKIESKDFDITFVLDKNEKTIVPFGILDFDNNIENPFFSFKYTLSKSKIDSLDFQIMDDNDAVIYEMKHQKPLIIKASKKPEILFEAKKPTQGPLVSKTWDYQEAYKQHALLEPADYTQEGEYYIHWDGFDNNEIYDSTRFDGKTLKAKIIATKDGKQKSITVDFTTKYNQVQWTDVKIDKKAKKIDLTLRVNLSDGGAEGLNKVDAVSSEAIAYYKNAPITTRAKTYADLEKITLQGINQFWSRNSKNIGGAVKIGSDDYEVYVNAKADKKGLSAPSIVYQTNTEEGRSRNFELSRKLFFHEGYLYRDYWKKRPSTDPLYINKGWQYINADIEDYKMVSAHEIGHQILLTYGGHIYSKTHKGTSHWSMIIQDPDDDATYIPKTGEIDLMKYYIDYYDIPRTIISEFDLLKAIWLTKLIIKPV